MAAPLDRANARSLQALRRKLDAWALEHLRDVVAEQAEHIDALERQARHLQEAADYWQQQAEALREDVGARGGVVQLHRDGGMSIAYGAQGAA